MLLYGLPLSRVDEPHLRRMIAEEAAESRTLEYKAALPNVSKTDERNEFLRDITAMANAEGGHFIFGMTEKRVGKIKTAIAEDIAPIEKTVLAAEVSKMESQIRELITPKIQGLRLTSLDVEGGQVLVIEIPPPFFGVHYIRGRQAFMRRGETQKDEMAWEEIRAAFIGAESATQRLQEFRANRLALLAGDEAPLPSAKRRRVAFHLLPVHAFSPGFQVDLTRAQRAGFPRPRDAQRVEPVFDFEGFSLMGKSGSEEVIAYSKLFRNGALESAHCDKLGDSQFKLYHAQSWALATAESLLYAASSLGLPGPYYLGLALLNIKGSVIEETRNFSTNAPTTLQRDHLILPQAYCEEVAFTETGMVPESFSMLTTALRPTFDQLWNAAGCQSCLSYRNGQYYFN